MQGTPHGKSAREEEIDWVQQHAEQLVLDHAHSLTGHNAIRLLNGDGIKRYSVGILVFMIGVVTPFT